MINMITYGTLNLACFYESITKNPSYRPTFRLSYWSTALLGAVGCVAVMILMAPLWALVSLLAMAFLHWWISRKEIAAPSLRVLLTSGGVGRSTEHSC